ncbi:hypothetical protein D3C80_1454630 [compost metagenome]
MAAAQQANIQRHVQARSEAVALLHQSGQVLLDLRATQQRMADATKQVDRVVSDACEQIGSVDLRARERDRPVEGTRWQQDVVGIAE